MKREGAKPNRRVRIEKLKLGGHFLDERGNEYVVVGGVADNYVAAMRVYPKPTLFPRCRLVKKVKA